ncbi:MAG: hypothetical protein Kow0059_02700 [Candidatus Sumerlaeia bacterium]
MPTMRLKPQHLIIALLILMGLLAACTQKNQANRALAKARERLAQAERFQAKQQDLDDLSKRIEEAQNLYNSGDFKSANTIAGLAAENAKTLVESSKRTYANTRFQDARNEILVATKNNGPSQDPERFQKIQKLSEDAGEALQKEKWDRAINLSDQIINEVTTLLEPVKIKAETMLNRAEEEFRKMQAEGASTYAPEYIIDVQNLLKQARSKLEEDKDYLTAQNNAENALRTASDGILRTQMKKAQEQIQLIETDIAKAVQLRAPLFVPELYEKVLDNYDKMMADFEKGLYTRVLDTSDFVRPQVRDLLYETRKASARDRIETTQKVVDALAAMDVRTHLPGRLEKVEDQLAQARDLFGQEKFEETEDVCNRALDETDKITEAFNDLASVEINKGLQQLTTAQNLFDKLPDIFIIHDSPDMSDVDRAFERNKQAYRIELQNNLETARRDLADAKLRQDEGVYNRSIEKARDVQSRSGHVVGEIYHIVAHNALVELSAQISYYEREGARIYATEELDRTQKLILEVRDLFNQKQYKEAMDKAAEARSQVEVLVQAIAQTANVNIKAANEEIIAAPRYETERFRPDDIKEANRLVSEALTALAANQLKRAIELSQQAALLARRASINSARQWANEAIDATRRQIEQAEQAGAAHYAGKTLEDSKQLLEKSLQNFTMPDVQDPNVYLTAKDQATGAGELAREALYSRVIQAEAAINEAKSAGGWEFDPKSLSTAIVQAKQARDLMEAGEFERSHTAAGQAQRIALKVAEASRNNAFSERLSSVEGDLNEGLTHGMNYFQVSDAQKLLTALIDVKNQYSTENFTKSMSDLDELQAIINNLKARTPEVLNDAVEFQKTRLAKLEEANAQGFSPAAFDDATLLLKYARIDFDKGLYLSSYQNLRRAIRTIDQVALNYDEELYRQKANEALTQLKTKLSNFGPVTNLSPEIVLPMVKGVNKRSQAVRLVGGKSVNTLREDMEKLFLDVNAITPPKTQDKIHKELIETVNTGRLASIYFTKFLILDQFDRVKTENIVREAFSLLDETNRKISRLQQIMVDQETTVRLVDAQK